MKTLTTAIFGILLSTSVFATEFSGNLEITSITYVSPASFSAGAKENAVVIKWSAKNESSANRYEIERSFYSNNFTVIAAINIPFINTVEKNYSINDNSSALSGRAVAYYRVKQTNAAGVVAYSNTMVVSLKEMNATTALPTELSLNFSSLQNGTAHISIKTITGQIAATFSSMISKGKNTVALSNNFVKGIYIAEVYVNGLVVNTQKIIAD
jgi:hypothetical protein